MLRQINFLKQANITKGPSHPLCQITKEQKGGKRKKVARGKGGADALLNLGTES